MSTGAYPLGYVGSGLRCGIEVFVSNSRNERFERLHHAMEELGKFLKNRIEELKAERKNFTQGLLAKRAGIASSTITRWTQGDVRGLTFESCLRIARALEIDPIDIFQKAGMLDHEELYRHFRFPEYRAQESKTEDLYSNPEHIEYHDKLQAIFGSEDKDAIRAVEYGINAVTRELEASKKVSPETRTSRRRKIS